MTINNFNPNEIPVKYEKIMDMKNVVIARQHNTKSMQLSGKLNIHAQRFDRNIWSDEQQIMNKKISPADKNHYQLIYSIRMKSTYYSRHF